MKLTKEEEYNLKILFLAYETSNLYLPLYGRIIYPKFLITFFAGIAAKRVKRKHKKFIDYIEFSKLEFKNPLQ